MDKYAHILSLPHWNPVNRRRMSMDDRAAQFSSFAALTGHDEAIAETGRYTIDRADIEPSDARLTNAKLTWLIQHVQESPQSRFTYYLADPDKEGGSVATHFGLAKSIDEEAGAVKFADGTSIPLCDIIQIDCESFNTLPDFWD